MVLCTRLGKQSWHKAHSTEVKRLDFLAVNGNRIEPRYCKYHNNLQNRLEGVASIRIKTLIESEFFWYAETL